MNIKGKITFWDRLGILISGNKNMLFIQFCKEVPKASKPSSNTRTSHPDHSQIPAHLPWLQQQFLPLCRKWDKAGGKGWHSPCTKWPQKPLHTSQHQFPPIHSAFQSGSCSVVAFPDFSKLQICVATSRSLLWTRSFPRNEHISPPKPSYVTASSIIHWAEISGILRWELIIHKQVLVN